jgi:hypothetical protein
MFRIAHESLLRRRQRINLGTSVETDLSDSLGVRPIDRQLENRPWYVAGLKQTDCGEHDAALQLAVKKARWSDAPSEP